MRSLQNRISGLSSRYLNREIDREAFALEFADIYFEARRSSLNAAANRFCSLLVGPFSELSRGHRSEDSFRQVLAKVTRELPVPAEVDLLSARMHLVSASIRLDQHFADSVAFSPGMNRPTVVRVEA